jgi:predicted dehydrogenase
MTALMEKRIAIIGSGNLAAAYRDALTDFPDLALDAVTDPNLCRAQPASEQRPRLLRAADDLLRSTVPHLALICTPPARHLEEVSLLLRAGLDVLVESPLAGTRTDAEEITSLAERIGRVVMTAEKFRVFDAVLEARKRIDLGRVGRLVYVEVTRSSKLDVSRAQHGNPHAARACGWPTGAIAWTWSKCSRARWNGFACGEPNTCREPVSKTRPGWRQTMAGA